MKQKNTLQLTILLILCLLSTSLGSADEVRGIVLRKNTSAVLAASTTYLVEGEPYYTTDTKQIYIGDASNNKLHILTESAAGAVTIADGTTTNGTLTVKNGSRDMLIADANNNGRLKLSAISPHTQYLELFARNGTTGSPSFGGPGGLGIVTGASNVMAFAEGASGEITIKSFLVSGQPITFLTKDTGTPNIAFKAIASQTANLTEWRNSSATPISAMSVTGALGLGNSAPVASAKLEMTSTTQGFLPPRMTTVQKNAIASPAEGLTVYDLDLHGMYFWNGAAWTAM